MVQLRLLCAAQLAFVTGTGASRMLPVSNTCDSSCCASACGSRSAYLTEESEADVDVAILRHSLMQVAVSVNKTATRSKGRSAGRASVRSSGELAPDAKNDHEDALTGAESARRLSKLDAPSMSMLGVVSASLRSAERRTNTKALSFANTQLGGDPFKTFGTPAFALATGLALLSCGESSAVSKLLVFFGAQTFMNLYMKSVLSEVVVSESRGLLGIQAPFAITAIQQVVGFVVLFVIYGLSKLTACPMKPKILTTWKEWRPILGAVVCFSVNIGLNNLSLSMLDISTNTVIRSAAPVATIAVSMLLSRWMTINVKQHTPVAILYLALGVVFGCVVVSGKAHGDLTDLEVSTFWIGVVICFNSLLAASAELVFLKAAGDDSKLNPVETVLHMSLPVALLLCLPTFMYSHLVQWEGYGKMTDWQVLQEVMQLSPTSLWLVVLSGVFSVAYNVVLYAVVQGLSPTVAAVASNFNKVATLGVAFFSGMDTLPPGTWGRITAMAVFGNMACFTLYALAPAPDDGEKSKGEGFANGDTAAASHMTGNGKRATSPAPTNETSDTEHSTDATNADTGETTSRDGDEDRPRMWFGTPWRS